MPGNAAAPRTEVPRDDFERHASGRQRLSLFTAFAEELHPSRAAHEPIGGQRTWSHGIKGSAFRDRPQAS